MIKQKSDCRLPKVLVQKVGDVAYIFINLNEEECSETDDKGNVHDYFIYDFNEFHVKLNLRNILIISLTIVLLNRR